MDKSGKLVQITTEPSPYVMALRRRIHELEENGKMVDNIFGLLVEKGLMPEYETLEMKDNAGPARKMTGANENATVTVNTINSGTARRSGGGNPLPVPVVLLRRLEDTSIVAPLNANDDDVITTFDDANDSKSGSSKGLFPPFNTKCKCIDCDKGFYRRQSESKDERSVVCLDDVDIKARCEYPHPTQPQRSDVGNVEKR
ncbi:unnamed protein product [Orchesella dallaii]|uniref:Uncharacterized protein n=1 Tax=Orchesella dallaii TaxID=48710 RepID=A0ABP1S903_9HEXA